MIAEPLSGQNKYAYASAIIDQKTIIYGLLNKYFNGQLDIDLE